MTATESDTDPTKGELLVKLENGVLWLTINRAEGGNAIPYYVRDALSEHFKAASTDLTVRAIVLTAAGQRHFCTGADLRQRPPADPKPADAPESVTGTVIAMMRAGFQRLMENIQDCQKPVIVALNGTAAGGGAMLALAADLVIAADNAKLIQIFVKRGLIPDGGAAYLLPRLVGMHKAKELVFFGDDLSAVDAEKLGIVNKVVPAAELEATAREWAERLAQGPTMAIGWAKKLLQDAFDVNRTQHLTSEAMYVELNMTTQDSKEGVASFMERRPSEFKGW
jgi:2-(1,2-epoxy-1,2-dihydrophenyl)acetyl-CoA isomerase